MAGRGRGGTPKDKNTGKSTPIANETPSQKILRERQQKKQKPTTNGAESSSSTDPQNTIEKNPESTDHTSEEQPKKEKENALTKFLKTKKTEDGKLDEVKLGAISKESGRFAKSKQNAIKTSDHTAQLKNQADSSPIAFIDRAGSYAVSDDTNINYLLGWLNMHGIFEIIEKTDNAYCEEKNLDQPDVQLDYTAAITQLAVQLETHIGELAKKFRFISPANKETIRYLIGYKLTNADYDAMTAEFESEGWCPTINYAAAKTIIEKMSTPLTLTTEMTHVESFFDTPLRNAKALAQVRATTDVKKQASIIAEYCSSVVKFAAPRVYGAVLMNKYFIYLGLLTIFDVTCDEMVQVFFRTGRSEKITEEELTKYQTTSRWFRDQLFGMLSSMNLDDHDERIELAKQNYQLPVSSNALNKVRIIVNSMRQKRKNRKGDGQSQNETRYSAFNKLTAQQMKYFDDNKSSSLQKNYDDFLNGYESLDTKFLLKRTNKKDEMNTANLQFIPADGTKTGHLILTGAILAYKQRHGELPNLDEIITDDRILATVLSELELLEEYVETHGQENNKNNSKFQQQCANMDIIFNFFLWIRCTGAITPDTTPKEFDKFFRGLNGLLYKIGFKFVGQDKIASYCDRYNIFPSNFYNRTGSIYMAPYALTYRRMYDLVSVFGMLKWDNVTYSVSDPGISPRYLTSLRLDSEKAMVTLYTYWQMQENSMSAEDINEAEHIFHQILLKKRSPYFSMIGIDFNMMHVEFVAYAHVTEPEEESVTIEELDETAQT